MMMLHRLGNLSRATLGLVFISASLLVVAGWRYVSRELPAVSLEGAPLVGAEITDASVEFAAVDDGDEIPRVVKIAVDEAPFSRFRGGSEDNLYAEPFADVPQDPALAPTTSLESTPSVVVHGIAASGGGGGMAAVQIGGAPAQIVRIGETISGYRLTGIAGGEVRLEGADSIIVVRFGSLDM